MEDEAKPAIDESTESLVARMDRVAGVLLDIVEKDSTSEAQKGRLFAQCLNYCKVRPLLVPSGEGSKLEEMKNAIKSSSHKRNGSTGQHSGAVAKSRTETDGRAIAQIIKSLPKPAHTRSAGRDSENTVGASGGGNGDGGGIHFNGAGGIPANVDGAGNGGVV